MNGNTLPNNSIINMFDSDYYYYGEDKKRLVENLNSFQVHCTGVQGNHEPIWKADFFTATDYPGVLSESFIEDLFSARLNPYVSVIFGTISDDISGNYQCVSNVSGIFVNFILTSENPFVKAKFGNSVNAILGERVALTFYAASDSTGNSADRVSNLEIFHTLPNGSNETLFAKQQCNYDGPCFEYVLVIKVLLPRHAGSYTAILKKCDLLEDQDTSCTSANDTIAVTIETPGLIPSHDNIQAFIGDTLILHCIPTFGSFNISWFYDGLLTTETSCNQELDTADQACVYPLPYNNYLQLNANNSGLYTCRLVVSDEVIISRSINVSVVPRPYSCFRNSSCAREDLLITARNISECCDTYDGRSFVNINDNRCFQCPVTQCPLEYNSGIIWRATNAGSYITVSCGEAGTQFSTFEAITRRCSFSGQWEPVDFTNCTLVPDVSSFATLSIALAENEIANATNNEEDLIFSLIELLNDFNLTTYQSVKVKTIVEETATVAFEIQFADLTEEEVLILSEIQSSLLVSNSLGAFTTQPSYSQLFLLKVANSCPCDINSTVSEIDLITKCSTPFMSNPCQCTSGKCQCQSPYVGNGILCTIDTDGDSFPDKPLETCSDSDNQTYCIQDNCISVYNPNQDPQLCQTIPDFDGCGYSTDSTWGIEWANTPLGFTDTQPCPPGSIGTASRVCSSDGVWGAANVINCIDEVYRDLLDQADRLVSSTIDIETRVSQAVILTQQLADASSQTLGNAESILPASINATNRILNQVLGILFDSFEEGADVSNETEGLQIAAVINNLLEGNQLGGWDDLQTTGEQNILGSDILLLNIEQYGLYLSLTRKDTVIRMSNIGIRAKQYAVNQQGSLFFPQPGDLADTDFPPQAAYVSIPVEVIDERAQENGFVPVASILCRNMEMFLEFIDRNDTNESRPASLVWSGQVSSLKKNVSQPINLTFRVEPSDNSSQMSYRCVFWNGPESKWSTVGVSTIGSRIDEYGNTVVDCQSNHLTPFAVLVDVSGATKDVGAAEYKALQVVSYVGCAISLVCLLTSIVFFLTYGKKLLTSVHFFIHLNLAISLFCGYFIFAVGVETARGNQGGCGFVAALLHYFFLSSFCWMLCEGIMLYLMLIVVFSSLSKKWYLFLAIGWVTPLLPVIIGLAAGYNDYGVRNDNGDLQFCWLSTRNGVIWAFVAPMIVIILINIVFLVLALRSVWRTRGGGKKYETKGGNNRNLVLTLLKATLILLPLLGLTWIFGLLSVDRNTTVFAWIFTLLNTAQGLAILFLHVLRSERIWLKISPYLHRFGIKTGKYELKSQSSTSTLKSSRYQGSTIKYHNRNAGFQMSTMKKQDPADISEEADIDFNTSTTDDSIAAIEEQMRIRKKEKEAEALVMENNVNQDES